MAERKIIIREATLADLDSIVYLYTSYMFDSYFMKFGSSFVKKYLKLILTSRNCIILVAEENRVVGFIIGTINCKRLLTELIFNKVIFCTWVKNILSIPGLVFESLGLIFYPFNTRLESVNAELLFIAIEPAYRKKGLAAGLINRTLSLMRQKGIKQIKVSVLIKNQAVNILLEKLGFQKMKTFKLFRKEMHLYSFEEC